MSILGWILFVFGWVIGIVIIPFGLPGTFVIVVDAFIFALLTDFQSITWNFLAVLLGLSLLVELIEFFLSAAAAKKYGSSKWGMWGAIIGGFFGAVWATPISPIFGTIFGAFIGTYLVSNPVARLVDQDVVIHPTRVYARSKPRSLR